MYLSDKRILFFYMSHGLLQTNAQDSHKTCWVRMSIFVEALLHIDVPYLYWGGTKFNNSVSLLGTGASVQQLAMLQSKSVVIEGGKGIHLFPSSFPVQELN